MLTPTRPWHLGVIIPARNEEALIGRCLAAVHQAADVVRASRPGTTVDIVVVVDACTDRTAEIVGADARVRAVRSATGMVGAARAAGVAAFAATVPDPDRAWLANTDADSAVPPTWLCAHLDAAQAGHAMLVGLVRLDDADAAPGLLDAAGADEPVEDGHDRIYGANLGMTLRAYRDLGGFPAARAHEDVHLVRAARAAGLSVHACAHPRVVTSSRLRGRAPEGVAAYLRAVLRRVPPPAPVPA